MSNPYFYGNTFDDLLRYAAEGVTQCGELVSPTKGDCKELTGVLLTLSNPRARLSRSEMRGKLFSALGELCWYLAGSNDVHFINYYIPAYPGADPDGTIYGGYGPRLLNLRGINQIESVIERLSSNPNSRRAVIQLFEAEDLNEHHNDIPCTCVLHFLVRNDVLHLITYMRSNDLYLGLPHDVFCFTMIQELVARRLSVEVGTYKHAVGSLHLYKRNEVDLEEFLKEGWQDTTKVMPPMPMSDPRPSLDLLLTAEEAIRNGTTIDDGTLDSADPYWADLIRLLMIFRNSKDGSPEAIDSIEARMSTDFYRPYIEARRDASH